MERVLEPIVDSSALVLPIEKIREKPSTKTNLKQIPPLPIKNYAQKLTPEERLRQSIARERPAWIPDHITADWDTDPYAYQTEEEFMSASWRHNMELGRMWSELDGVAEERGWTLYMDNLLLYHDKKDILRRIAPDLLIAPHQAEETLSSSYVIETQPLPLSVFEIVSPSSKDKDMENHELYVEYLKIPTYVVIWLIDDNGKYLSKPSLDVWHRDPETGRAIPAESDAEGKYYLPELQLWIGLKKRSVYFVDEVTGETLANVSKERLMRQAAEKQAKLEQRKRHSERIEREIAQKRAEREAQRAEAERQARKTAQQRAAQETQRAEAERQEREAAQQRAEAERREREAAQQRAEQEAQRAEAERQEREAAQQRAEQEAQRAEAERQEREAAQQRAEQEAQRAEQEAQRAEAIEDENARLRALIQQLGINP